MIARLRNQTLQNALRRHPAVALLGSRQVGKTTLALAVAEGCPAIYLDLESPADQRKLTEPELYLREQTGKLVILDEIQRVPELFPVLRGLIDERRRAGESAGQFLILGSASIDLLRQSSESLAGRILYLELPPILCVELPAAEEASKLWLRGGYPESLLAESDAASLEWRQAFISTYLERDIPALGPRIPAETLRRLWTMLAHEQGAPLNAAKLASSLGVSGQTIARYLDLLVDLFLVRRLPPWATNTGKRLVRSPKVYVRDSGLTHALLEIAHADSLAGHPVAGPSWEGHVVENLAACLPQGGRMSYYRTAAGAEIDLVLELSPEERWAVEIKRSRAPKLSKGYHAAFADTQATLGFVVYAGEEEYPLSHQTRAIPLPALMLRLRTWQDLRFKGKV
jgi:predicted AAA+ superfamily ATPase